MAAVRGWVSGWEPTADDAIVATRARDVFTSHPPLVGTWASASLQAGRNFNHPSPLAFDVLAPLVRVLGAGHGTLVTVAAVNLAAVVTVAWLARRRLGSAGAALVMVAITTLVWSLGSAVLIDPWPVNWPILAFLLFLFSAWSVATGDAVALVPLVVAGSFCLGSHLSYVVLIPAVSIAAVAPFVIGVLRRPRADNDRGDAVRWTVIAVVVGLACWLQPMWDEVRGHPGNLTGLVRSSGLHENTAPSAGLMLRIIGGTVVLPPAWLPPTFAHPTFHADRGGAPLWLATVAITTLIAVWILSARSAWRRHDRTTLAALGTAAIGLGAGTVTVMRMPVHSGIGHAYLRWVWPLGLYVWVATTVAVVQAFRARQPVVRHTHTHTRRLGVRPRLGLVSQASCVASRSSPRCSLPTTAPIRGPGASPRARTWCRKHFGSCRNTSRCSSRATSATSAIK